MRRRNFLACISVNKCYRNEINSTVYVNTRGIFSPLLLLLLLHHPNPPVHSSRMRPLLHRRGSSPDIRQLESMPGRVHGNAVSARISSRNGNSLTAYSCPRWRDSGAKCIAVNSRRMIIGRSSTSRDKLVEQASYYILYPWLCAAIKCLLLIRIRNYEQSYIIHSLNKIHTAIVRAHRNILTKKYVHIHTISYIVSVSKADIQKPN